MTEAKMSNRDRMVAQCLDAGDGSGNIIIERPDNVLEAIGAKVGDELSVEKVYGVIVLKPIRDMASAK
ncbi:AbrB/MazE/SpoVT family DNA-binding domain-containing protein [Pseudomonas mohnii]